MMMHGLANFKFKRNFKYVQAKLRLVPRNISRKGKAYLEAGGRQFEVLLLNKVS